MTARHATLRVRTTRRNGGQGMVLLSLFLVVLVGLVGLGVDGGSLYMNRRQVQNAADAAALAGAFTMARGDTSGADICAAICKYASANYIDVASTCCLPTANVSACYTAYSKPGDSTACIGTVDPGTPAPPTATGVQVTTKKQASTFFMPILGFNTLQVQGVGAAHGTPPAPGGPGYGLFAIKPRQPLGSNVLSGSVHGWTFNGAVHSNSDIKFDGANTFNGSVQYVTGTNINSSSTFNPGPTSSPPVVNPVQSTVLPDPVNKTLADFNQGPTSTATYHYFGSSVTTGAAWTPYITNGVLQPGVYYVNGSIAFGPGLSSMSATTASDVTFVATGSINISISNPNFTPYQSGMLFFGNTSSADAVNVSASGTGTIRGLIYAPNANARYSGSQNIVGGGSIVGWTINITNNSGTLTYDPSIFPSNSTAEIFLYK